MVVAIGRTRALGSFGNEAQRNRPRRADVSSLRRPRAARNTGMIKDEVHGIFGAGALGREIAWLANMAGFDRSRLRFVVDHGYRVEQEVAGIVVLDLATFLQDHPAAPMFVAIGNCVDRRNVVERLAAASCRFPYLVSPNSVVSDDTVLSDGAIIFPGAVVSVNVHLGPHVHINKNATISHDVKVGAYSSVSPAATVCGKVEIEEEVFIGANSCVVNGTSETTISIGRRGWIGPGTCVTRSSPPGVRLGGVRARPIQSSQGNATS